MGTSFKVALFLLSFLPAPFYLLHSSLYLSLRGNEKRSSSMAPFFIRRYAAGPFVPMKPAYR